MEEKMEVICKKCGSSLVVKNGAQDGRQRDKCKAYSAVFRNFKPKYSAEFKMETIKMYMNSI
jgi:transposase-like protein